MFKSTLACVLLLLAACASAEWLRGSRSSPDTTVELVVAVKQQNLDVLESLLFAVSDPDSPAYGKHLTNDEIHALIAPEAHAVDKVVGWLASHGITDLRVSPNSDFIVADVSVAKMEQMTGVEFYAFQHKHFDTVINRPSAEHQLPESLKNYVDFVAPRAGLPHLSAGPIVNLFETYADKKKGGLGVTPDTIRALYGIDADHKVAKSPKNRQACAQFLNQFYSPSDLESFKNSFNKDSPFNLSSIEVIGPNTPTSPGIEANLDIQYITAIGNNVPTQFWSTLGQQPGSPENEPFLKWLYALGNTSDDKIPYVMSVSYGDNEDSVNLDYAKRVNVEFQKAGLRGISLIFASGDGGVAGGQSQSCTKFVPTFPAGSPYVTAVGGSDGDSPETTASFSSGGFSNYWEQPSYQTDFVAKYLQNSDIPDKSLYNSSGAAIPDVSAQSNGFWIVQSGIPFPGASGTSAAAPTFSGIISLLNDARLAAGKSPLGYLNPFLYKNPGAFNDVTTGSNPGCGTNGFPAKAGWDPATGLGTPNFPKLLEAVLALP